MTEVAERPKRRSRKKTVNFDLEGAWFADLVRTRVAEGCWEHALEMLTEGLEGIEHKQCVQVLTGRADLSGWASDKDGVGFNVLPPDHELAKHMDEVHERLYGQCFRRRDDYWKPYAVVSGYNAEDLVFAQRHSRAFKCSGFPSKEGWKYAVQRALFYANSADADLVVYVPHPSAEQGTVVLCEPARMPPTWIKTSKEVPEAFLEKLLKGGKTWPRRGAYEEKEARADFEDEQVKRPARRPRAPPPVTPAQSMQSASEMANEFLRRLNATETSDDISALGREFENRFDEQRDAAHSLEADDTLKAARRAAEQRIVEAYRRQVTAQADAHGGWLELRVTAENGGPVEGGPPVLRLPRNPFLLWGLRGFDYAVHGKERPVWRTVCPQGLKTTMDDPNHTDWVVGAGLDPDKSYALDDQCYDARVQTCAFSLRAKLVSEWTEAEFVTLARGVEDRIYGDVVFPGPNQPVTPGCIAVVPNAGPDYQLALETACKKGKYGRPGAVICETGGKLAHLAVVGRELRHTLLMVPNARKRFPQGTLLTIDVAKGKLSAN